MSWPLSRFWTEFQEAAEDDKQQAERMKTENRRTHHRHR